MARTGIASGRGAPGFGWRPPPLADRPAPAPRGPPAWRASATAPRKKTWATSFRLPVRLQVWVQIYPYPKYVRSGAVLKKICKNLLAEPVRSAGFRFNHEGTKTPRHEFQKSFVPLCLGG